MSAMVGDTVIYNSKVGDGILSPAIVLRTQETTNLDVINRWGPDPTTVQPAADGGKPHETSGRPADLVAELSSPDHVDLVVFGLGKTYREYNVPYDPSVNPAPGTWRYQ